MKRVLPMLAVAMLSLAACDAPQTAQTTPPPPPPPAPKFDVTVSNPIKGDKAAAQTWSALRKKYEVLRSQSKMEAEETSKKGIFEIMVMGVEDAKAQAICADLKKAKYKGPCKVTPAKA